MKAPEEVVLNSEFTFEMFEEYWKKYTQIKQKEGQNNIAALFSIADLEMESANKIRVTIPSEINKVELEKEFFNFKPYLAKELKNNQIHFHIRVAPEESKEFYITTQEKYQKLLEINPTIAELRDKLDLDI